MKFFNENKKWFGAAFAGAGAICLYLGYVEAAATLGLVATHLGLAGATKSDREAKLDR